MPTFLCGHGNWHLEDGFARVPSGTQVTFYTQNAKTLFLPEALKILEGTTQFQDSQLDIYHEGQSVPNMTLSDGGPEWRAKFELSAKKRSDAYKLIFADKDNPKKLSDVMQFLEGEQLVWVACRALALDKISGLVGGEKVLVGPRIGVNVRENPTTLYSAYIASKGEAPKNVDKGTFRGFMPPGWNVAKP